MGSAVSNSLHMQRIRMNSDVALSISLLDVLVRLKTLKESHVCVRLLVEYPVSRNG